MAGPPILDEIVGKSLSERGGTDMRESSEFLILGAGPAGLTLANKLLEKGVFDFLVLEKEEAAGGLCRSVEVDGAPFDVGGGHFLDVRNQKVNDFLFQFMPENEWNLYIRDSRIQLNNVMLSHPIEANIWQLELGEQVEYLKSIALAGCNLGLPMPEEFVDWIYWKLGRKIAEEYMLPYNQKMFGAELNQLGTYWLAKLPNVSFEETLLSCLSHKAYGKQPGHAKFYYPREFGYGELWLRMAQNLGQNIQYNKQVESIDFIDNVVRTSDGSKYCAKKIITTIPWMEFQETSGMPDEIRISIQALKYSSIQTEYYPGRLDTQAHWIYYPSLRIPHHRILVRHNISTNGKGYWTETNGERIGMERVGNGFRYMNRYAYPLNTVGKPKIMNRLLRWSEKHNVYGLGRWGEHQHYNSDVTVELAINMCNGLVK